jgi:hypothetical protein
MRYPILVDKTHFLIRRCWPIFAEIFPMEQTKKYKGIWWLVFLVSTAALIFAIYSHWEWLTLILPFQTTAFVKALDIM